MKFWKWRMLSQIRRLRGWRNNWLCKENMLEITLLKIYVTVCLIRTRWMLKLNNYKTKSLSLRSYSKRVNWVDSRWLNKIRWTIRNNKNTRKKCTEVWKSSSSSLKGRLSKRTEEFGFCKATSPEWNWINLSFPLYSAQKLRNIQLQTGWPRTRSKAIQQSLLK